MQENPRYSSDALRLLLAQYLDGALDADQLVEVELLLDRSAEAQAELLKLQQAKGRLQDSLHPKEDLQFSKVSDMVWKNIACQLEADSQTHSADYDYEFISSYYDNELDSRDPAHSAFEAQLFHNDEANQTLADISALSEAIRQFGYRQEEACTIDVTHAVMEAYQSEAREDEESTEALSPVVEMISAFIDDELPAKDIIELNRLIEQEPDVRAQLAQFTQVSDAIRFLAQKLESQATGDYWHKIKQKLLEEEPKGQVVPFLGNARSTSQDLLKKVAIPAAAAALLVLLSIPGLRESGTPSIAKQDYNHLQLASVPMGSAGFMRTSYPSEDAVQNMSSAQPLEPVTEPSRQLVSRQEWTGQNTPVRTPSSEEYLFRALEEQDSDISNVLGK